MGDLYKVIPAIIEELDKVEKRLIGKTNLYKRERDADVSRSFSCKELQNAEDLEMTTYDIREVLPGGIPIPVPLEGNPLKELKTAICFFWAAGRRGHAPCWWIPDSGQKGVKKALLEGLAQLGVSMEDTGYSADPPSRRPQWECAGADPAEWKGIYQPGGLPVYGWNPCRNTGLNVSGKTGLRKIFCRAMLACTPSRTMAAPLSFRDYTPS